MGLIARLFVSATLFFNSCGKWSNWLQCLWSQSYSSCNRKPAPCCGGVLQEQGVSESPSPLFAFYPFLCCSSDCRLLGLQSGTVEPGSLRDGERVAVSCTWSWVKIHILLFWSQASSLSVLSEELISRGTGISQHLIESPELALITCHGITFAQSWLCLEHPSLSDEWTSWCIRRLKSDQFLAIKTLHVMYQHKCLFQNWHLV